MGEINTITNLAQMQSFFKNLSDNLCGHLLIDFGLKILKLEVLIGA